MGKGNPYRWGSLPGAWGFGPDDNFVNKLGMVARKIDARMALCASIGPFFQASGFVQPGIFRYSAAFG